MLKRQAFKLQLRALRHRSLHNFLKCFPTILSNSRSRQIVKATIWVTSTQKIHTSTSSIWPISRQISALIWLLLLTRRKTNLWPMEWAANCHKVTVSALNLCLILKELVPRCILAKNLFKTLLNTILRPSQGGKILKSQRIQSSQDWSNGNCLIWISLSMGYGMIWEIILKTKSDSHAILKAKCQQPSKSKIRPWARQWHGHVRDLFDWTALQNKRWWVIVLIISDFVPRINHVISFRILEGSLSVLVDKL